MNRRKIQRPKSATSKVNSAEEVAPFTSAERAKLSRRGDEAADRIRYVIVCPLVPRIAAFYVPCTGGFALSEIPLDVLFKRRPEAEAVARLVGRAFRRGRIQVIAVRLAKGGVRIVGSVVSAIGRNKRWKPRLRRPRRESAKITASGPTLQPPAGYSSWLAYAVETMDDRSLENDHDWGGQPQWSPGITRARMREAARAEFAQIRGHWGEMDRASRGEIETTHSLADWAETEIARRETAEISANPAALTAIARHRSGKTTFEKIGDIRVRKK